jgi:DNA-binding PadR family transcriptional regulator
MHGFAIARWIRKTTDDALEIEEGALYPALHRMERKGWVESDWGRHREQPPRQVLPDHPPRQGTSSAARNRAGPDT